MLVHAEFTADDRVSLEIGARGIIIRYETYRQLGKVNYSVKGYEPFFEGEWLPIARYDNRKGYAQREVVRPMLTYSAIGLQFKDNWGNLSALDLFDKALNDIADHWQGYRSNYDDKLPPVDGDKEKQAKLNLALLKPILADFVADAASRTQVTMGQSIIPMPKDNDWLLEANSKAIGRIDKKALRGELRPQLVGPHRVLTHEPHPVEETETTDV